MKEAQIAALLTQVAALQQQTLALQQQADAAAREAAQLRQALALRDAAFKVDVRPFPSMLHAIGWVLLYSNTTTEKQLVTFLSTLAKAAGVVPPTVHQLKQLNVWVTPVRSVSVGDERMCWVRIGGCLATIECSSTPPSSPVAGCSWIFVTWS